MSHNKGSRPTPIRGRQGGHRRGARLWAAPCRRTRP
ncbi:MAG: phage DNA packaging protein J [Deltaproteobacteria bacterium]|nr:phage DNA packaging protein J [Deltaproteobacteria bacterium]